MDKLEKGDQADSTVGGKRAVMVDAGGRALIELYGSLPVDASLGRVPYEEVRRAAARSLGEAMVREASAD